MITRKSVLFLLAIFFCFPIVIGAADRNVPGQPFKNIQNQVNELLQQLRGVLTRFTPPTIAHSLSCAGASSLIIDLTFADDRGLAYFAIQEQGGNPPANILIFVEPELTTAEYQLTVDPGPGIRKLLFIAQDIEGNVNNSLLEIAPDVCF
ncbi:MAG: hypothetical protein HY695_31440 [Deltaproteobacteria bacterium]|nr:hypothetical protein [Deltaproteobacteria bacterium]